MVYLLKMVIFHGKLLNNEMVFEISMVSFGVSLKSWFAVFLGVGAITFW